MDSPVVVFNATDSRRLLLMQCTSAAVTATAAPASQGTFRTCFSIRPARNMAPEQTPWLSPLRDPSILHYGEPACLCLQGQAQDLRLLFRRNRVAPLQVVQFAPEEDQDTVWQVNTEMSIHRWHPVQGFQCFPRLHCVVCSLKKLSLRGQCRSCRRW